MPTEKEIEAFEKCIDAISELSHEVRRSVVKGLLISVSSNDAFNSAREGCDYSVWIVNESPCEHEWKAARNAEPVPQLASEPSVYAEDRPGPWYVVCAKCGAKKTEDEAAEFMTEFVTKKRNRRKEI